MTPGATKTTIQNQNKPLKNSRTEVLFLYTFTPDSVYTEFFFPLFTYLELYSFVLFMHLSFLNHTIFENEPDSQNLLEPFVIFHMISKWLQSIAPTSKITTAQLSDVKVFLNLWMQITHKNENHMWMIHHIGLEAYVRPQVI